MDDAIELEPFAVSLSEPLKTARGPITERKGFLVRIDHRGTVGVGEATPLPGWTESHEECERALERGATIAGELDWGVALAKTEVPAARHGLSLALADARAQSADRPLYRYLGREATVPDLAVNTTLGASGSPAETASRAAAAVDAGFETVKVKVGTRPVEDDVERVRAVRTEVGEDVALRVDANGAWTPDQAERALRALAHLDVEYVEQPLSTAQLDATATLPDAGVDIALDESVAAHGVDTVIEADAADLLVLKPMVLGGPDLAVDAAARCRAAGVEPVVSTTVDAVVARTGAVHVAASIPDVRPCGLATGGRLATDLGPDPAPVSEGSIHVPQGGGLGLAGRL